MPSLKKMSKDALEESLTDPSVDVGVAMDRVSVMTNVADLFPTCDVL